MGNLVKPKQDLATLAQWGTENLTKIIAIDSQSDEASETIPSTEGQRVLSAYLQEFFEGLGYEVKVDPQANVIVRIPARGVSADAPTIAMMCHIDTSQGTTAVTELCRLDKWDGGPVPYPENDRLRVTADDYTSARPFKGEDILFGPGKSPIGLDDKLGICELMTMAQVLKDNPDICHGELLIVLRPDEEIGRMEAVMAVAEALAEAGVRYGYTIDGLQPFEVNTENFNASRGDVRVPVVPLTPPEGIGRRLSLSVLGVKSHGATAKPEGYYNANIILTRTLARLADRDGIFPVYMDSDPEAETDAQIDFLLWGADDAVLDNAQQALLASFREEMEPHSWRGAQLSVLDSKPVTAGDLAGNEGSMSRVVAHLQQLLDTPGVDPPLSEDSDHYEGYSNPYFVAANEDGSFDVRYRLRAFDPDELKAREQHLRDVCAAAKPEPLSVDIAQQYINMGPTLAEFPQLPEWAVEAARAMGQEPVRGPIRGGTGVDPFLERGIPIANVGTGYFAPESEKELTSRQSLARHALWLTNLVQIIGAAKG